MKGSGSQRAKRDSAVICNVWGRDAAGVTEGPCSENQSVPPPTREWHTAAVLLAALAPILRTQPRSFAGVAADRSLNDSSLSRCPAAAASAKPSFRFGARLRSRVPREDFFLDSNYIVRTVGTLFRNKSRVSIYSSPCRSGFRLESRLVEERRALRSAAELFLLATTWHWGDLPAVSAALTSWVLPLLRWQPSIPSSVLDYVQDNWDDAAAIVIGTSSQLPELPPVLQCATVGTLLGEDHGLPLLAINLTNSPSRPRMVVAPDSGEATARAAASTAYADLGIKLATPQLKSPVEIEKYRFSMFQLIGDPLVMRCLVHTDLAGANCTEAADQNALVDFQRRERTFSTLVENLQLNSRVRGAFLFYAALCRIRPPPPATTDDDLIAIPLKDDKAVAAADLDSAHLSIFGFEAACTFFNIVSRLCIANARAGTATWGKGNSYILKPRFPQRYSQKLKNALFAVALDLAAHWGVYIAHGNWITLRIWQHRVEPLLRRVRGTGSLTTRQVEGFNLAWDALVCRLRGSSGKFQIGAWAIRVGMLQ